MMDRISVSEADVREIGRRICSGEVFVYPTDTVYGIGCNAMDAEAVERIFKIKKRAGNKPLSVAFSDMVMVLDYVDLEKGRAAELYEKLPGPYTFIVRNKRLPKEVTGGLDTIGIRIPDYPFLLNLIKSAGVPIVTTSANVSGEQTSNRFGGLSADILKEVDFSIDAGRHGSGKASTVINTLDGKILR